MITRRDFIMRSAAVFTAAASGSVNAIATAPPALSRLIDIDTNLNFAPGSQKFNFILFMTAGRIYPSCGEAFLCLRYLQNSFPQFNQSVRSIFVLPKVSDQMNSQDKSNLASALSLRPDLQILTGDLADVQAAALQSGAFYQITGGKVIGHAQDMFFTTPSGKRLFSTLPGNVFVLEENIGKFTQACAQPEKRDLCR